MFEKSQYHNRHNPYEFEYLRRMVLEHPENALVIDIETTGFDKVNDSILQFSAIDGYGRIIYNQFFNSSTKKEWDQAAKINGIYPNMVANKDYFEQHNDEISDLLASYPIILGYNHTNRDRSSSKGGFDINFLEAKGVEIPQSVCISSEPIIYSEDGNYERALPNKPQALYVDVMREFGCYIDENTGKDRFYKLTTACNRVGITEENFLDGLKAHNSIADTVLTLGLFYEICLRKPIEIPFSTNFKNIPNNADAKIKRLLKENYSYVAKANEIDRGL